MAATYLPYRPPYPWHAMLAFLAARAVPTTETVIDGVYRRSLRIPAVAASVAAGAGATATATASDDAPTAAGVVTVRHAADRDALEVTLSPSLVAHAQGVLERIAHLFDLDCDPAAMAPVLGELASDEPGLRLPGAVDVFEIAVRAILGQQVTVAAARTLATRLVTRFGTGLSAQRNAGPPHVPLTPSGYLARERQVRGHLARGDSAPPEAHHATPAISAQPSHLFPAATALAAIEPARLVIQLGEIGIVRVRGQAIAELARRMAAGELPLAHRARRSPGRSEAEAAVAALCAIHGIGPWTAHYIVMRGLGWSDAFPPGDLAARNALGAATPAQAFALAERWRPWRGYALMHLWRQAAQASAHRAVTASAPSSPGRGRPAARAAPPATRRGTRRG